MEFRYADARILERYAAAVHTYYCRFCGRCEGSCPRGVEIGTVNRALMYAEGYRSRELAVATYRELPVAASAATCLDCAACVARCPNGLDVAAKMERARAVLA
jgi:predicted aldo/keto reductase-like oxidoreductase